MKRIVIARHASTAWTGARYQGRTDLPLTPQGREEASALARMLAAEVAYGAPVVASPLQRAVATGQVIAGALGGDLRLDDRLAEADCGLVDGLTFAEVEQRWPVLAARLANGGSRVDWPRGETWSSILGRAVRLWCDVATTPGEDIVLVTHGVLAATLCHVASDAPLAPLAPAGFVVLEREIDRWIPRHPLEAA